MGFAGAMAVAMAVDALLGWPSWLFARIGHPVTWLGALIGCHRTPPGIGRRIRRHFAVLRASRQRFW